MLEILGDHLASSTSKAAETGVAARCEELPLAGSTQADKSKDTETATADRALSQTSLDTPEKLLKECSLHLGILCNFSV